MRKSTCSSLVSMYTFHPHLSSQFGINSAQSSPPSPYASTTLVPSLGIRSQMYVSISFQSDSICFNERRIGSSSTGLRSFFRHRITYDTTNLLDCVPNAGEENEKITGKQVVQQSPKPNNSI